MEPEILKITDNVGDDGTNNMVNRFTRFKEKVYRDITLF